MYNLKDSLAELYSSENPKVNKDSLKRLRLNKAVARSFQKRLKILSEAIEELNLDIHERARKSQQVQEKIDGEIFHLEFVLKELEKWTLGQVEMIETRRLGLERESFGLKQQKRSECIREWSDISTLKRKRREFIMDYENLLRTKEMIE
jgi:hypothetical protein